MLSHVTAPNLVRHARRRARLTQRALAERSRIPQPMISAIESGRQDPRYSTLDRLLRACGYELDFVHRGGEGVDRTLFTLRLAPEERLRQMHEAALSLEDLVRSARRA